MNLWDEIWFKYPHTKIVYGTEKGKLRELVYSQILPKREGLLLDLGCGDGHMKPYVKNYVGLDISKEALKRFKAVRINGTAEYLPFRNETFNHVLICETLEHVKEHDKVLRECYRILKPNGEIIISAPYGHEPFHKSSSKSMSEYNVTLQDYLDGRFNRRYLTLLLMNNGFTIKFMKVINVNNIPNNIFVIGEKQ